MEQLLLTLIVGAGATVTMDAWGIARKQFFGMAPPNYALVGRWIGHMARGRFHHDSIVAAAPLRGERMLGWVVHYLTGFAFAGLLIGIWGPGWVWQPAPGPAFVVGIGTVLAPFLLMQPGMGAGIAASRTPRPTSARIQSLITHAVFGFGLYATAWVLHLLVRP